MKIIVGLGNPGKDYENTPHNAGFHVIDELERLRSKLPKDVILAKSNVFMNDSGLFVDQIVDKYRLDLNNLYIVHDDLDILLGSYKIQFGRGPKDHNGIKSIDSVLGTNKYWHVRIGVDNRPQDNRVSGEEYVLREFPDSEKEKLGRVIKEACHKIIQEI